MEEKNQIPENEEEAQPVEEMQQQTVEESPEVKVDAVPQQENAVSADSQKVESEKKVEDQKKAEPKPNDQRPEVNRVRESGRTGSRQGRRDGKSRAQVEVESEFIEKVLSIRRVTKVTKGGKKLSFSALVVVGDGKSCVGYAHEKAGEVAIAIRRAMAAAKKNMVKVTLKGTTIPHEIIGAWGGARVLLKPASEGTGVIASGTVRAICDGAGIHNILTKCHRSNNPVNVVKATMDGLTHLKTARS